MEEETPPNPTENPAPSNNLQQTPPGAVRLDVTQLPANIRAALEEQQKQHGFAATVRMTQVQNITSYQSPVPPPEVLAAYKQIDPKLLDRIVTMAEQNGEHLRATQRRELTAKTIEIFLGQGFAFIVTLAFLAVGGYLVHSGHDLGGSFVSLGGVGAIISRFILGRDGLKKPAPEPKAGEQPPPPKNTPPPTKKKQKRR